MPFTLLPDEPEAPAKGKFTLLPDEPPRSTGQELARQGGLTVRHLVEGVAGLPNMIGDTANRLLNYLPGVNLRMPSEVTSRRLTDAGLPEPESATERVVGDISRSVAGAGGLAKVAASAPGEIAKTLAAAPGQQLAASAAAGGAGGVARESGASPVTQLLVSLAAGVAAPGAVEAGRQIAGAAGRAAKQVAKPFTQGGREEVVGAALNRMASDPVAARAAMAENSGEIIPGSLPTTAQASRDPGLLTLERAISSAPETGPQFAARKSSNNTARNAALDDIAQTPEAFTAAKVARSEQADELYQAAFNKPLKPDAPIDPLLELSKRPAFQAALKKAADIAAESGENIQDLMTTAKGLHYVKLALDDTLETAPTAGLGKTQQRAIAQTREKLLTFLDDASPEYAQARAAFRESSGPVNAMEAGQKIQAGTRLAGPDVTGEPIISQAKWQNVVTKQIDKLGKQLTPAQVKTLQAIGADLDQASLSATAGKASGSNTFQNLSTANMLGAALGDRLASNSIAQTAMRPLQWLYKIPEAEVRDLLTQAMLDPSIARAMMAKATPQNLEFLGAALKDRARSMGLGAAVGANEVERR